MTDAPAPRANPDLHGHERAERALRGLFDAGRLPHALLLCGPRGIGKATLAFRLARFMLASSSAEAAGGLFNAAADHLNDSLAIPPTSDVFHRVASGGHADLRTIERAYDATRRRLRGEIVVDDVRKIAGLLRRTPGEDGWRIVVVDGADEMNRNAANALLKILEEPPRRALLLLVAHSPGRLLPTIRSRCRRFPLGPLPAPVVRQLLTSYRPELAEAETEALVRLADGSIGRALELAAAGGVELYRSVLALSTRLDPAALHDFSDKLARPNADTAYGIVGELVARVVARAAVAGAGGGAPEVVTGEGVALQQLAARASPARWAELRDEIAANFLRTEQVNLDRKQAIFSAFFAIDQAAG